MSFLKVEVEEDERRLQVKEFAIQNEVKKKERAKGERSTENSDEVATASTLINSESKSKFCVLCDADNHDSVACFKAKKMSLNERKKYASEKKCCFKCLKIYHRADK